MSVIQNIRDKYARVAVIAIAVSLIGFILTDYISGRSSSLFSSGNSTTVGRVNGTTVELTDFEAKVKQQEDYQKSQGYYQGGEAARQQIIESVWNQEVDRILLTSEINKLNMQVGKREINDMLFGANPPQDIKQIGTDPATGVFNPQKAQQTVNELKKRGTPEQKQQFNEYINQMEFARLVEKYNSLLNSSSNFPRWFVEKTNADNSLMARVSLVRQPYTSVPDSAVQISDNEIADYISKHKDDFKQEESRSISYVIFSASPSKADTMDAYNKLLALKPEFDTTKDVYNFIASQGAPETYKGYISGKEIRIAAKDSIFRLPVNGVYGPYPDGPSFNMAKLLGVKAMPDSVKVRHILAATMDRNPQTGQMTPKRDSASARHILDSAIALIKGGQPFDSVCAKLSDDGGSKDKGGVYEIGANGGFVPEFSDFIFTNPVGTKGVVKTDFGLHYIEILSAKGSTTGYKVAYLPSAIVASAETDGDALNKANQFAGDSKDSKAFDANFDKNLKGKGYNKLIATDITPNAYQIPGIGVSRLFVKEIYKASQGDVLQPQRIDDNYVVATVVEVNKEGTKSVAKARALVEPLLRNKKKAELLAKKVGNVTSLEAASTTLGQPIEMIDSLRMTSRTVSSKMGYEPKVSGAIFNPANKGKVVPAVLDGVNGVYVVRVEDVTATALGDANVAEQRKAMYMQAKQSAAYNPNGVSGSLRKAATIKDKRASLPQL